MIENMNRDEQETTTNKKKERIIFVSCPTIVISGKFPVDSTR